LESSFPFTSSTTQFGDLDSQSAQLLSELRSTSEVVIVASLLIAGCSLAVAMAVGIVERKRPFGLLRLTGVPVRALRRIVALETALPLLVISMLSAVLGLVASDLFLRSQFGETLRMPGAAYLGIVSGGFVASLAIIGSSLPLLEPLTRPENSRLE
jgi:ABC-type antimicrobial peptide transport system permease subunit